VVRRGDTLARIAARTGVPEGELVALNGIRNRHRIAVGQTLKLPPPDPPPAAAGEASDASPAPEGIPSLTPAGR
jgi:lipoprotein NlpD